MTHQNDHFTDLEQMIISSALVPPTDIDNA